MSMARINPSARRRRPQGRRPAWSFRRQRASGPRRSRPGGKPALLAGGNPQIAKADGELNAILAQSGALSGTASWPAGITTVRSREGKTLTPDGPFAETREGVGGFFLVDVQDLAAAIKVAERAPRRPLRRRRDPPGAGVAAAVYIDRPGYAGPGRSKRPKCFSTRVRGAQPSMAARSSRLRRSGSARISISTTLPPAIVKPSTANRWPSGRRDRNPRWPLTRTS